MPREGAPQKKSKKLLQLKRKSMTNRHPSEVCPTRPLSARRVFRLGVNAQARPYRRDVKRFRRMAAKGDANENELCFIFRGRRGPRCSGWIPVSCLIRAVPPCFFPVVFPVIFLVLSPK